MRTKLIIAVTALAVSTASANAGGLLDAQNDDAVAPIPTQPAPQGSLRGAMPFILIGGLAALALGMGSGSGS